MAERLAETLAHRRTQVWLGLFFGWVSLSAFLSSPRNHWHGGCLGLAMASRFVCAVAGCLATAACHDPGGPEPPTPRTPPISPVPVATSERPAARAPAPQTKEEAHRLVMASVACWLGEVWSDAPAASEQARSDAAEQRCQQLVVRVHGSSDQAADERLRAIDPSEVSQLKDKLIALAQDDSVDSDREQELCSFLNAAAEVERETIAVRQLGKRLKGDTEGGKGRFRLTADEVAAMVPLTEGKAFDALLTADVGELTAEARAVALLCAMDRTETARGLTRPLNMYAVEGPYSALFHVPAPDVPRDETEPLTRGTWLAYLSSVAFAAGHPVPDWTKSVQDRQLLAWGAVYDGLAHKLRDEIDHLSDATDLKRVAQAGVLRLAAEHHALEATTFRVTNQAIAGGAAPVGDQ